MNKIFIGRQPIFDDKLNLYAYELLYRDSPDAKSNASDNDDSATSQVLINTFMEMGLEQAVGDQLAFFNLSRTFIDDPELICFPPEQTVIEVPKEIGCDPEVTDSLRKLSASGYPIALDNFVYQPHLDPLVDLADIIKIDIHGLSHAEIEAQIEPLKDRDCRLIASKIETPEELTYLTTLPFDYFQGQLLGKPKTLSQGSLSSNRVTLLQLLAKVNNPDVEVDELEQLISLDIGLSTKILRFMNSPSTGLRREVESIREAVIFMGRDSIKKWVTLIVLAGVGDSPQELMTTALVRARTCEELAKQADMEGPDAYFTVGLFSALDTMLNSPMEEILATLPLTQELQEALLHLKGDKGKALQCALDLEMGNSDQVQFQSLEWSEITSLYLLSLHWSDEAMKAL
ncbi:MAG: HDOD domain-containing protein [Gammaproteobacteria bacterium]|nr:HDOD domain-containing protein [Gammaproteobacteria bacterium]